MPDPSQFNTDRTYLGRWTTTFGQPADQTALGRADDDDTDTQPD